MSLTLIILLSLAAAGLLCLLYGFFLEPSWIKSKVYDIPLPEDHPFRGRKILFFSDLHVGRKTNPRKLRRQMQVIQKHQADLILFGGDLVEEATSLWDQDFKKMIIQALDALEAPLGKWAIYGNHDVEAPRFRLWVTEVLASSGFRLLENEILPLPDLAAWAFANSHHDQPIFDAGQTMTPIEKGTDLPFALFLIHESDYFPLSMPWSGPGLVLAGHSHHGQVTLFGLPLIRPPGGKRYWRGRYQLGDKLSMIVSAGMGTVHIHARFFARPDILLIRMGED
jgi:predicted MPP superfamily phosphohydrolase